jgi:hypothetical protein
MNNKWTNGVAPLRISAKAGAALIMNIPEKSLVIPTGERSGSFERVVYWTDKQPYVGWVYIGWLEDYEEHYPANCVEIPNQTPDLRDAAQYFLLNGIKQTNICGEACAAYILGKSLQEILDNWKREEPSIWKSVFGEGKLRGTGYGELISIFEIYSVQAKSLTDMLTDPVIARPRYTVSGLRDLVASGNVIAGVNIDNAGRLKPSGMRHWVVVTAVHPERTGYGTVEIYNPFPNRIEIYSWNEFHTSAKVPTGVYSFK